MKNERKRLGLKMHAFAAALASISGVCAKYGVRKKEKEEARW